MPPPRHPARHRPRVNNSATPTAAAIAPSEPSATKSAWGDYAAGNEEEIAAHFPIPSVEVADRLVDLLIRRHLTQPKDDNAA